MIFYVDSLDDLSYEDNVKSLLTGTPFYPHQSPIFNFE